MPRLRDARGTTSRAMPRVLLLVAVALLIARVGTGVWEHQHPPALGERLTWRPLAAAQAEAAAAHKPILYEFSAEWCGPCKVLSSEVFADDHSAHLIESWFVPVRVVDTQREQGHNAPDVQALQDKFKVDAFPTLVVYNPANDHHESVVGYMGKAAEMQELTQALVKVR